MSPLAHLGQRCVRLVFLPSFNCVVAIIAPLFIPIIAHIHDSSGSSTSVKIRNCPIDYWRLTAIKHEAWDTYFLSFFPTPYFIFRIPTSSSYIKQMRREVCMLHDPMVRPVFSLY